MAENVKIKKKFWVILFLAPAFMFVFAIFILPPLYEVICDITGFNGKTGRVDQEYQYENNEQQLIEVDFFVSTMPGFAVKVKPKVASMEAIPGEFYTTTYIAKNNTDYEIIGQAVPSVAPREAAIYFKKLECFCFNRQVFKPQEEIEMQLRFVIEPGIKEDIHNVSLSYNFFKLDS